MRRFEKKPLSFARLTTNARVAAGDEAELRRLAESYKKRPIHPIIVKTDGTIVDGMRRILGLRQIGETEVEFLITDEDLTPDDIIEIGLVTAMHRADLTGYEKWQGCKRILERHPGWLGKDLAAHLNIDPSMIARLLAPSNTIPAVQEAFRQGAVNTAQVYEISHAASEQQQQHMLAAALDGAGREQLRAASRKTRDGSAGTAKLTRVKAPLPSGVEVAIAGQELGLEDVIESLGELLKEAKKASDAGLDVKTWAAILRDKAKAGEP